MERLISALQEWAKASIEAAALSVCCLPPRFSYGATFAPADQLYPEPVALLAVTAAVSVN